MAHGQEEGDECQQHRLAQELPDELSLVRADDLPQTDLLGPLEGSGRGQVHVIDAGDDQDEDGDRGEQEDEAGVSGGGQLEINPGGKMDLGQGLKKITRFFGPGGRVGPSDIYR